jgi:hypothetical protein
MKSKNWSMFALSQRRYEAKILASVRPRTPRGRTRNDRECARHDPAYLKKHLGISLECRKTMLVEA